MISDIFHKIQTFFITTAHLDISPLKEYATGKKLTVKEAAKASEKRDKYQKFLEDPVEQANYLESKYGPGPEPDDFASGGIARMLGE